MNADRMKDRGIGFLARMPAALKGMKLTFNKIANFRNKEGFATIEPAKGELVEGILYKLHPKDIRLLDIFEGFPAHYEKWTINVKTNNGIINAITYIANPVQTSKNLLPSKDYLLHLLAGKEFLSEEYFAKLKNQKTVRFVKFVAQMLPNQNYRSFYNYL